MIFISKTNTHNKTEYQGIDSKILKKNSLKFTDRYLHNGGSHLIGLITEDSIFNQFP